MTSTTRVFRRLERLREQLVLRARLNNKGYRKVLAARLERQQRVRMEEHRAQLDKAYRRKVEKKLAKRRAVKRARRARRKALKR